MRNFVGVLFWCANLEYLKRLYSDQKSMTGNRINRFPWKSCQALLRVTNLRWARTYKFLVSCWNPTKLEYFNSAELLLLQNGLRFWAVALPWQNFQECEGDLQINKDWKNPDEAGEILRILLGMRLDLVMNSCTPVNEFLRSVVWDNNQIDEIGFLEKN